MPIIGQLLFPSMMKARAPAWYELSMAATPHVRRFCRCTQTAFEHGATFALPTMFQNYLIGSEQPFASPDQPTLAIWGEQDDSHLETDKMSSKTLAKSVEVVSLKHVGHFPELEDPQTFAVQLERFTSKN